MDKSNSYGLTKVPNRKKTHKKPSTSVKKPVTSTCLPSTSNSFEILLQPKVHILDNQKQPEAISKTSAHSAPSSSKKSLTSKQPKDTKTPSPSNMQKRTAQGMEVYITQMQLTIVDDTEAEQEIVQHMEEEPKSFDIGDLDILGLEQAYKKKEYDKIPKWQLESLEVILSRAQKQRSLGVQTGSQWDGRNIFKDNKKWG